MTTVSSRKERLKCSPSAKASVPNIFEHSDLVLFGAILTLVSSSGLFLEEIHLKNLKEINLHCTKSKEMCVSLLDQSFLAINLILLKSLFIYP